MVNIKKIIKQVKSGNCSYNSFNFRIKTAEDYENDAAAQWLAQHALEEQEKQQQQPQGTPIPSNIPVTPSSQPPLVPEVPPEISDAMDSWIRNNRNEMLMESDKDIATLELEIGQSLKNSPIGPDYSLYTAIAGHPDFQKILIDKINQQTTLHDVEKASLFIDTMLAKTEVLREDIEGRETEIAIEEKQKELLRQRAMDARNQDPYNLPASLEDPHVEVAVYNKFMTLTPAEKWKIYDDIHGKFKNDEVPRAAQERFKAPDKPGHIDQRMNFFLRFPQYLVPVMDEELVNILAVELPNMGVMLVGLTPDMAGRKPTPQEVIGGLSRVYAGEGSEGAKRRICNILSHTKGDELLNILMGLVESANSDIFEWMKGSIFAGGRMTEHGLPVSDEEGGLESEVLGLSPRDLADLNMNAADKKEASGVISDLVNEYLEPWMDGADKIRKSVVTDMMSDATTQVKNLIFEYLAPMMQGAENIRKDVMTNMMSDAIARSKAGDSRAMKLYEIAEQINAFVAPMQAHFKKILESRGKPSRKDPTTMTYRTPTGRMNVPLSLLKDVFKKDFDPDSLEDTPDIDSRDHKALIDRYIGRIQKGEVEAFSPYWGDTATNKFPVEAFKNLGALKWMIRRVASRNPGEVDAGKFDNIRLHIEGMRKYSNMLNQFAMVEGKDPSEEKIRKINDFIYMTLNQKAGYDDWLRKLGGQTGEKFKTNETELHHQLKAIIGGKYSSMLGYVANQKDAADAILSQLAGKKKADPGYKPTKEEIQAGMYESNALRTFIGLVDLHPNVRNFLRDGRMPNAVDSKHRTNTELYYHLKGVEPPSHIKEIANVYNEGVSQSTATYGGLPAIQPGSWYSDFFKEYDRFDRLFRKMEKKRSTMDSLREKMNQRYPALNAKAERSLSNIMSQKGQLDSLIQKNVPAPKPGDEEDERIETKGRITQLLSEGQLAAPLKAMDYKLLGVTGWKGLAKEEVKIHQIENGYMGSKGATKQWVEGTVDIEKNMNNLMAKLDLMLKANGYQAKDPNAFRFAREAYSRALVKIAALERMKRSHIKVASAHYVDIAIAKVKADFNNYFNSLFS